MEFTNNNNSNKNGKIVDVNVRTIYAFRSEGNGYKDANLVWWPHHTILTNNIQTCWSQWRNSQKLGTRDMLEMKVQYMKKKYAETSKKADLFAQSLSKLARQSKKARRGI